MSCLSFEINYIQYGRHHSEGTKSEPIELHTDSLVSDQELKEFELGLQTLSRHTLTLVDEFIKITALLSLYMKTKVVVIVTVSYSDRDIDSYRQ